MAPKMYAEDADLTADPLPKNTLALIRLASSLVEHATRMARYSVDEDGYPTDYNIRETFRQATVAHVDAMVEVGADRAAPVLIAASESFGGASKTYVNAGEVALSASQLRSSLCLASVIMLRNEGLVDGQPSLW